ncbi:MAG: barstar family protein [Peptoniphilaceae bacterium]|nr:barstar family protein [Peptoniphilaceae bacterium]MDD7383166.1 barstar family protein [Peptoniphilaceae bacterium]MDY3738390.1 barstar family protein [Peptoniphilaceae bacterium]
MKKYIIDSKKFISKEKSYSYLNEIFKFDYYVKNLDALFDQLSSKRDIIIEIKNSDLIEKNLGEYGKKIIETFSSLNSNDVIVSFLF